MTMALLQGADTETIPPAVRQQDRPHIVLVVPRGEAVRNFLYSETLRALNENARVTLLTVVDDQKFVERFGPLTDQIITLKHYPDHAFVAYLRTLVDNAHDRWLWSEVAKNRWQIRAFECDTLGAKVKRQLLCAAATLCANRGTLEALTRLEQKLNLSLRKDDYFKELFTQLKPDLVFNCSHIHGPAGELPLKTAKAMGIPTAGFIFSWDNLTSRSRIFVPYDHYLVWHQKMHDQLLDIYHSITPDRVTITGTPQFDFHFKPEFILERAELCKRIGADPKKPFILFTAGIDKHFPQEHLHVEWIIKVLNELPEANRPQLVVRAYVKGTSPEMKALRERKLPGVVFPPILWEEKWYTPLYEDLAIYTSLLRHCVAGINAASTVSLELMIHDKPIINLGFDPPGSKLPYVHRFDRHIDFDHFRPVAESGGTMVARSPEDMRQMIHRALAKPMEGSASRKRFMQQTFGNTLDGRSGERVAQALLKLASVNKR